MQELKIQENAQFKNERKTRNI